MAAIETFESLDFDATKKRANEWLATQIGIKIISVNAFAILDPGGRGLFRTIVITYEK